MNQIDRMSRNKPGFRLLVTTEIEHLPDVLETLRQVGEVMVRPNIGYDELVSEIPPYDGIITNIQQRLPPDFFAAAAKLKLVATPSTGTDHIDLACCRDRGIVVQSLKDDYDTLKNITSTAELAFLLMLSVLRRLPSAFDAVRDGHWERSRFRGREAAGRVVGIIGYGRLGEIFSRLAHGFGMSVLACDPYRKINDAWVEQLPLDELLRRSEIITIHVHLSAETNGMIGAREFGLMRPGAYLINTSRGKLIDEKAFLKALDKGQLAGAGIDVLAEELAGRIVQDPLVEYARHHDNLIISPHIGGMTIDAQRKAFTRMAEKVVDFFRRFP